MFSFCTIIPWQVVFLCRTEQRAPLNRMKQNGYVEAAQGEGPFAMYVPSMPVSI